MSRQYDRYERTTRRSVPIPVPRRGVFGHWIPLVLTVTVATIGLAAWIWSERQDDEEEDGGPDGRVKPEDSIPPPVDGDTRQGEAGHSTAARPAEESSSYMARMSGALKRTPSPQQFFDGASKTVVAGMAAAGVVVGNALSSIREEDKNAYKDHKTWSEEAESRGAGKGTDIAVSGSKTQSQKGPLSSSNTKKKSIAVVISADADGDGLDDGGDYHHEHAVRIATSSYLTTTSNSYCSLSYPIFPGIMTFRKYSSLF